MGSSAVTPWIPVDSTLTSVAFFRLFVPLRLITVSYLHLHLGVCCVCVSLRPLEARTVGVPLLFVSP